MNITELCVNCKQNNSCTMCWKTSKKKCPHFIQKTNADRIRAISDEEFVKIFKHSLCAFIGENCEEHCSKYDLCSECLIDWLKQPSE